MAGYSQTPLPKKLGIKDGFRVALVDVPAEVNTELREALAGCRAAREAPLDYIHVFTKSRTDFQKQLKQWSKTLAPAGMIWVSWPKKRSSVTTDLTEDTIREIGLAAGLVDVKVCAVTDVWSGLKFVIPVKNRAR